MVVSSERAYHSWLGPARNATTPFEDNSSSYSVSSGPSSISTELATNAESDASFQEPIPIPTQPNVIQYQGDPECFSRSGLVGSEHAQTQQTSLSPAFDRALRVGGFLWKCPFNGGGKPRRRWFQVGGDLK